MLKATYTKVIWVYAKDFHPREVPIVLLENGKPGYVINQYIYWLVETSMPPASLQAHVRSLCHLYEFTLACYGNLLSDKEAENLVANFITAKQFGTDQYCQSQDSDKEWLKKLGLMWKPLRRMSTIKTYLAAINKFDRWQSAHHGMSKINPSESRVLSAWEVYRKFQAKCGWDPLIHLDPSRNHSEEVHQHELVWHEHRRSESAIRHTKTLKSFPVDYFVELVDQSPNPRDKMLWLLMGGGGLRKSETLNLFFMDVEGRNQDEEAAIVLADPVYGWVTWVDEKGDSHHTDRQSYFLECFTNQKYVIHPMLKNLMPRPLYLHHNRGLSAGWKGMTYSIRDSNRQLLKRSGDDRFYDVDYLTWLQPQIGQYFYSIFQDYQAEYYWRNKRTGRSHPKGWPWHPWLIISTYKRNYGFPMAISSIEGAWNRALKRIGLAGSGLSPHSLRHMYGYYCANNLGFSLEMTKAVMHHASLESTQVYYQYSADSVSNKIQEAIVGTSVSIPYVNKPVDFNFPPHWK